MKKSAFLAVFLLLLLLNFSKASVPDDDFDGVPNENDKCINSETNIVDQFGCSCLQKTSDSCANAFPGAQCCTADNNPCTDDCSVISSLPTCNAPDNTNTCQGGYCNNGNCIAEVCGNNIIEAQEQCDGTTFGTIDECTDYSEFVGGTLKCSNCQLDTSQCVAKPNCGNGVIDSGEECDGNNLGPILNGDCEQYAPSLFTDGTLRCSNCQLDTSDCISQQPSCAECGSGLFNFCNEKECLSLGNCEFIDNFFANRCQNAEPPRVSIRGAPQEWSNKIVTATIDCSDSGSGCNRRSFSHKTYDYNPEICSTDVNDYIQERLPPVNKHIWLCAYAEDNADNSAVSSPVEFKISVCGDNIIEGYEECDGKKFGSLNNNCAAYNPSFRGGNLRCTSSCQISTSNCRTTAVCGDGFRDSSEKCDTNDFGNYTCNSYGYSSGRLTCINNCMDLNFSRCIPYDCVDTDNGADYYKKGDTYNEISQYSDYCYNNIGNVNSCLGSYCLATDFVCGSNGQVYDAGSFFCPNGCNDGACLNATTQQGFCGDGIANNQEECDGRDLNGRNCENFGYIRGTLQCDPITCTFDTRGCTNIIKTSCEDSDNGQNYYVEGTTIGPVVCSNNACDDINVTNTDICTSNKNIWEYYCDENGYNVIDDSYECPVACIDGACTDDFCALGVELDDTSSLQPNQASNTTSFAMLVNPSQNSAQNTLSLAFDKSLNIDTKELSEQMKGMGNVLKSDENGLIFQYDGKNAQPLMLTKNKDGKVNVASFKGYIVEFEDKPIILKEKELVEEANENEAQIDSMSDFNPLKYIYIVFSIRPDDVPDEVKDYEEELTDTNEQIKADIKEALIEAEQNNEIPPKNYSAGQEIDILAEYEDVFNGIALNVSQKEANVIEDVDGVKKVYPNNRVTTSLMDSVPLINADKVWQLDADGNNCASTGKECLTGKGVSIAVIDTGVDYTHTDLGGCLGTNCKVVDGYDFVNQDNDPMDDHGHGTHVAATAAGNGALKGVAPDAEIYAYKVLDSYGSGHFSDIIAAIERAVDPNRDNDFSDHVNIISMSLGAGCWFYDENCGPDDPVSRAVDNAAEKGVVPVIAAGNSGPSSSTVGTPGTARKAITVGAADKQKVIAYFSSRGPVDMGYEIFSKPDVVAPGVSICAAQSSQDTIWQLYSDFRGIDIHCLDEKHIKISGTSMATPHMSGAAALLLQSHPSWTPEEIKSALMLNAENLKYDNDINTQGAGFIDVEKANKADILITPASISFETIVETLPQPRKLIIKNNKNQNVTFNLKTYCSNINANKTLFTIAAGLSEDVGLSFDNFPQREGVIQGNLELSDDSNSYKIPYLFRSSSEIVLSVNTGDAESSSDLAITDESLSFVKYKFWTKGENSFYVPSGAYIVYAAGDVVDFTKPEYILMKKVDVPKNKKVPVVLDINEARPFKIKAQSLDGTNLLLYEWQKAYTVYNDKGCYLNYDLVDPQYGDRVVYVSNRPSDKLDTDVFFKYDGVPSKITQGFIGSSSSSLGWRLCERNVD